MLLLTKELPRQSSVGCVNPKVRSIGLKLKLMILFTTLIFASGCTEFALLASGSSLAISQNTYARIYNAADMLTIMRTEESIKKHAYTNMKKALTGIKEGKEYIYDTTINLFGNKH